MSLVLDVSALIDMNLMEEYDPRYLYLVGRTENESCLISPIVAAQVYFRLQKDVSNERADGILSMMRAKDWITIIDDYGLIGLAAQAMEFCPLPSIAFTAALAKRFGSSVVVGNDSLDNLELNSFCSLIKY
ncbi:MAG: type II toxin-antitoxin system VapC family toxin [Armatimonadetes bacterium]|nr:type II toxin-antitoxin system VapC family toxin [Armatimonadota bacterium]